MPLFNGVNLFGYGTRCTVRPARRRLRKTFYPGVDGFEVKDMGGAGKEIVVTSRALLATGADLAAYEAVNLALRDAMIPYDFVDSLGTTWSPTLLVAFEPASEEPYMVPSLGGVTREYRWTFEVLL